MQKIVCSKCNKIMGGSSTTSKNKPTQIYYKCNCCNTRINEKKIEQPLMLFLNDMLDYYLLIDNNYKSFFNEDLTLEIKRYEKILKELNTKLKRIKNAYLNSNIEQDDFIDEEKSIKMQIEETKDNLIYNYGIIKCKLKEFNDIDKKDIIRYRKMNYGYEILIKNKKELEKKYPNVIMDNIKIEDIMLMYVKGCV